MKRIVLSILIVVIGGLAAYHEEVLTIFDSQQGQAQTDQIGPTTEMKFDGKHQVISVNNNTPTFSATELSLSNGNWQTFSNIDQLNRVGVANAMLGKNLMPNTKREALYVNPSGWKNKKLKDGWLYNRLHLIGFQLTGENNNLRNLMTGTRSLNTPCMLEYENIVANYIRKTNHHVRYQVKPIFHGNELVARGVQLQAQSIEDNQVAFNVFVFNVEPGVKINYLTGESVIK
ncbi:DNA/RNA non-specific endonuclease [Listeria booriae]|uniref:DNA/RNA non-specific endonuclease n=1 Tax=Listeria booriae TaxID=1552123 RepID=UPI0021AB7A87|nr:DNA/RNA non-specific endonuclease [Listeria booriae]